MMSKALECLLVVLLLSVIHGNSKEADQELRLLLIGKTGVGKSTTGNVILGRQQFTAKLSLQSVTKTTTMAVADRFGRHIVVVDTPGIFDTDMTVYDTMLEIGKCHSMTSPGLHAVLFVVEIGRITSEEQKAVEIFLDYFGEEVYKYVILVFTGKDILTDATNSIEQFVTTKVEGTPFLSSFINRINHRYVALGLENPEKDLEDLFSVIDIAIEKNNGQVYTNEMYQTAIARQNERMEDELRQIKIKKDEEIQKKTNEEKEKHNKQIEKIKQKKEEEIAEFERQKEEQRRRHETNKYKQGSQCKHNHHGHHHGHKHGLHHGHKHGHHHGHKHGHHHGHKHGHHHGHKHGQTSWP